MDLLSQEGSCSTSYSNTPESQLPSNTAPPTTYYSPETCSSQAQWHPATVKSEFSEMRTRQQSTPTPRMQLQQQQQQRIMEPCSSQSQWRMLVDNLKTEPVSAICASQQRGTAQDLAMADELMPEPKYDPDPSTSEQYFAMQTDEPPLPLSYASQQPQITHHQQQQINPLRVRTSMQSPPQQSDTSQQQQQQLFAQMSPTYAFQHHLQISSQSPPCYQPQSSISRSSIPTYLDRGGTYITGQKTDPKAHLVYIRNQQPRQQPQIRPQKSDLIGNAFDYPPEAPIPNAWCHAYYYELNQRIGEPFKGGRSHVIVDGFCAPSEAERFCLGALANVNRNPGVINARRQIGRGVKIFRRDEDVYAECLSEAPIFVQSPIHALQSHDHPSTVYRLPPGHTMQLFDNKSFEALLEQTATQGFHAVYSLQRMCHMRISFVKGWGEQYKRQTITSTPCWIEIHLPIPLQKLDRILTNISGPTEPVHSFT